ncbi:MAG: metal-dependent transcriptional regulator [Actinomycetia bacterium]|jgi:DtxR family Mn-dependent transcriptional regulator|nr:metal-dependent transcriptional regulator [Actinomycetes bacterium]MCH9830652.1 metal-dependent transcriptional regulator [Actinomycetes bacterium]MCH9839842.1 metal-dependent transcriptional regulator [Actinomycetes bacterium]
MSDLIDTTEMYLRTIFELEEEGIAPMRARIAERLGQSGPTVSQTVARMERDGLVSLDKERHLELTVSGRSAATRVMRKHRLAECMLVEMLKMPWEEVHAEACRWEHVMSDAVELRLLEILGQPTVSPFGNPIPGLAELDPQGEHVLLSNEDVVSVVEVVGSDPVTLTVRRLAETIQLDEEVMARLRRVGALPGARVKAYQSGGGVFIGSGGEYTEVPLEEAVHIFVGA